MRAHVWRGLGIALLAVTLAACGEDNNAKGGDPAGGNTLNTAPRTLAMTVEGIMANPAVYYKQPLGIPGYIKEVLGPNALVISDQPGGEPGLLVLNNAQSQVSFAASSVNQQIYVQGDLRPFEEADTSPDKLPADQAGRFAGTPVLIASTLAGSAGDSGSQVTVTPLDGKPREQLELPTATP
jgi:hypothetical protein